MSGEADANSLSGAADRRVVEAAAERRRLRMTRNRDAEQATMQDVLVGMAERAADVTLVLRSGRSHRCRVDVVGPTIVASTDSGTTLVVGEAAVVAVIGHGVRSIGPTGPDPAGAGAGAGASMADILAQHAADEHRITAWRDTEQLSGTLVAVGPDVATLRLDGPGDLAYVRLDSTTEISVSASSSE